jgi:RNA-binding protein YhbY
MYQFYFIGKKSNETILDMVNRLHEREELIKVRNKLGIIKL